MVRKTSTTYTISATSTTVTTSTTSTTVPTACESTPTFASIDCRLGGLIVKVTASDVGILKAHLLRELNRAKDREGLAERLSAEGQTERAQTALRGAIRSVIGFERDVGSL